MSRTQLTKFMKASLDVANESMKFAGKQGYEVTTPVISSHCGLRECPVSLDAPWHPRGHYSNQDFAAQSILNPGGYWIMRSMIASNTPAANGRKLERILTQRSFIITGPAIKTPALPTIVEPLSPWNHPVELRSGEG